MNVPSFDTLSRDELIKMLQTTMVDQHTGFLMGSAAIALYGETPVGKTLVFVDFCNVHACNHHFGGMQATNEKWIASFRARPTDKIVKWGGDEIVVLLDDDDVDGYVARVMADMQANDVYAVFAVVKTSTSLKESVGRADTLAMAVKRELEETGQKPNRDMPYVCLASHVIYE